MGLHWRIMLPRQFLSRAAHSRFTSSWWKSTSVAAFSSGALTSKPLVLGTVAPATSRQMFLKGPWQHWDEHSHYTCSPKEEFEAFWKDSELASIVWRQHCLWQPTRRTILWQVHYLWRARIANSFDLNTNEQNKYIEMLVIFNADWNISVTNNTVLT